VIEHHDGAGGDPDGTLGQPRFGGTSVRSHIRLALVLLAVGVTVVVTMLYFETVGPPGLVPPPPERGGTMIVDCLWRVLAEAWVDANGNGSWDEGEQPLKDVHFRVDEPSSGNRDIQGPFLSNREGAAQLSVFLGGCPDVKFDVFALPPKGYRSTTHQPLREPGPLMFGFRRVH